MDFRRIDPPDGVKDIIECIWIVESDDPTPVMQKIVPDGFPEVIFHFGDPYKIKLQDRWELQSRSLIAGQITGHFFLENTGFSSMMGLKFRPAALTNLFTIPMHPLTDTVVDLVHCTSKLNHLENSIRASADFEKRIHVVVDYLSRLPRQNDPVVEPLIELIFKSKGNVSVSDLCDAGGVSERQLERLFKKYVGLSPKFYARVIRFSNIFEMMKSEHPNWTQLGLEAGFYDQSHFIRDFKAFTGEDPSAYVFEERSLANFFMRK